MLCDSLHAQLLTQSWLITMLTSLTARQWVRLFDGPDIKLFILAGWGRSLLSVAWSTGVQLVFLLCSGFQNVIRHPGISIVGHLTESIESSFYIHQCGCHDYLFVLDD